MLAADRFVRSGKVRDLYALDADRLLLVASDRLSAFDVVLPTPIPDKGRVLTALSRFWFAETASIIPNHLLGTDPGEAGAVGPVEALRGRSMVCRRADVVPVEAVVRGYLAGSGWKEYRETGTVCGVALPAGLRESDRLPEPIFTPATKEEGGAHDVNISFDDMVDHLAAVAWLPAAVAGPVAEAIRDQAVRLVSLRFGGRGARRHPARGHEVRVRIRVRRGRADPRRRGAHAGLLAVLGRGDVRAGARPGLLRQAVRA